MVLCSYFYISLKGIMHGFVCAVFAIILSFSCVLSAHSEDVVQPEISCILQSAESSEHYAHQEVCHFSTGSGGRQVRVFYPANPRPVTADVVLFLHGYRATDPEPYGGWIDHLVRSGHMVIFPVFEASRRASAAEDEKNMLDGVRVALSLIRTHGPVMPIFDRFTVVGHSFGGGLAARYAALAAEAGLPEPKAVMAVMPGWQGSGDYPSDILKQVSAGTYLLVVDGDTDQFQSTRQGAEIIRKTVQIPDNRKAYVMLVSSGNTIADHYAPLSPLPAYHFEQTTHREQRRKSFVKSIMDIRDGEMDSLDTEVLWRMLDRLITVDLENGTISSVFQNIPVRPVYENSRLSR